MYLTMINVKIFLSKYFREQFLPLFCKKMRMIAKITNFYVKTEFLDFSLQIEMILFLNHTWLRLSIHM